MQPINANQVIFNQNIQPKPQTSPAAAPPQAVPQNYTMQGADALAAYNAPLVTDRTPNIDLRNLIPASPVSVTKEQLLSLQGERIYDGQGKLYSLIQKTPQTTTVYEVTSNGDVSLITTKDNKTGSKIREELYLYDSKDGKSVFNGNVLIDEYDPNTGKCTKSTFYGEDGQLKRVSKNEYGPNDYRKCTGITQDGYNIVEESKVMNFRKRYSYDRNMQLRESKTGDFDGLNSTLYVYENGKVVSTKVKKDSPIENTTGKNPAADESLKPSPHYVLNFDPMQLQGAEKAYYSNGVVNTVTSKNNGVETVFIYEPDGKLKNVRESHGSYSKYVTFDNNYTSIDEFWIKENVGKETTYEKDGGCYVCVTDPLNDLRKAVAYRADGTMARYGEDSYKSGDTLLDMTFNKQGILIDIQTDENK